MADEAKKKPVKRAPQGPRPGYLILGGDRAKEFAEAIASGTIELLGASRKAEDVLSQVSSGAAQAYVRFEIK